MRIASRILIFVLIALLAFWFTAVNSGERVTVDLVILRLMVPLPLVVFGSVLVGMVSVLLVGLKADIQTRRAIQKFREVAASAASGRVPEPPVSESLASGRPVVDPTNSEISRPDEATSATSRTPPAQP